MMLTASTCAVRCHYLQRRCSCLVPSCDDGTETRNSWRLATWERRQDFVEAGLFSLLLLPLLLGHKYKSITHCDPYKTALPSSFLYVTEVLNPHPHPCLDQLNGDECIVIRCVYFFIDTGLHKTFT